MARIHFLNVEEGDCSIIQHNNGHVTMIDVCSAKAPDDEINKAKIIFSDINESVTIPRGNFHQKYNPENPVTYLQKLGVKSIFRYIQTHPDMDHMDGLQYIDAGFEIVNFWDTANTKEQDFAGCTKYDVKDWNCYQRLRNSTDNPKALNYYDGIVCKYFAEDDNGRKQDDYLQILAPTKQLVKAANEAGKWNDLSYVILYHIHGHKVLFCGDAGNSTWDYILTYHAVDIKNIDVLIAPHHGRKGTLDFSFLDVMKPKLSLIGNALNKDLAYDEWNNRKLLHFTNNQVGNVMLDFGKDSIWIYCSNKKFVDSFLADKDWDTFKHRDLDTWYLSILNNL